MRTRSKARHEAEVDALVNLSLAAYLVNDVRWNQESRAIESKFALIVVGEEVPESWVVLDATFQEREANVQLLCPALPQGCKEGDLHLDADGQRGFQMLADLGIPALVINGRRVHLDHPLARHESGCQKGELTDRAFLHERQRHGAITGPARVHFVSERRAEPGLRRTGRDRPRYKLR